ncbi:MAG: diadenylate cyclase [Desulfosporosinus sp.]|nr:diadenylate cyclase [Desulfosporosinus sp.]
MKTQEQANILIANSLRLARETTSDKVFLFLNSEQSCRAFGNIEPVKDESIVLIIPKDLKIPDYISTKKTVIHTWFGNQSRFSRIKYAFMQAVLKQVIQPDSKVVCVLGPWGKDHLDTITIHDLRLSWSEEFPFDPRSLMSKKFFQIVIAVVDIALDIGAMGREGKSVGTTFIIGNVEQIMKLSHQAIFNPFRGYPEDTRNITSSEVVESVKELAQLDGAFIISEKGIVEAAGRHLDAVTSVTRQLKGFGSRHRAAASITMHSEAIAVVVSESTGRVTVFDGGKIIAALDPVISTRVV